MQKILLNKWQLALVAMAVVIGWISHAWYDRQSINDGSLPEVVRDQSYDLTKPILFIDNASTDFQELAPLKEKIGDFIEESKVNGSLTKAGVYFRELDTGKWTGVDEDDLYIPSSMLKVAILMVYLNLAQSDPQLISKPLFYNESNLGHPYYPPAQILKPGNYSVQELLSRMIIDSDNAATLALKDPVDKDLYDLLVKIGLPIPPKDLKDFMSPASFSFLFRSLYSSTYLPPYLSEQALKLLTQTSFKVGLVAGVPRGVLVSHKFGEHTENYPSTTKPSERELHDCGIIYYPKNPYLLCVMTKGGDFSKLEKVISGLSALTYKYVDTSL